MDKLLRPKDLAVAELYLKTNYNFVIIILIENTLSSQNFSFGDLMDSKNMRLQLTCSVNTL